MYSSNDLVKLIKSLSLTDRLKIVESILRDIREEKTTTHSQDTVFTGDSNSRPEILSLSGIISDNEADILQSAVDESRLIEQDEW